MIENQPTPRFITKPCHAPDALITVALYRGYENQPQIQSEFNADTAKLTSREKQMLRQFLSQYLDWLGR